MLSSAISPVRCHIRGLIRRTSVQAYTGTVPRHGFFVPEHIIWAHSNRYRHQRTTATQNRRLEPNGLVRPVSPAKKEIVMDNRSLEFEITRNMHLTDWDVRRAECLGRGSDRTFTCPRKHSVWRNRLRVRLALLLWRRSRVRHTARATIG